MEVGLLRGLGQFLGGSVNLPGAGLLPAEGLDDHSAAVRLLHQSSHLAQGLLAPAGPAEGDPGEELGHHHGQQGKDQKQQGHDHVEPEHHHHRAHNEHHGGHQAQDAVLHGLRHLVHVVGEVAQGGPGLVAVQIGQGQAVELLTHLPAQPEVQLLGKAHHEVGLQGVKPPGAQVEEQEHKDLPSPLPPGDHKGLPQPLGPLDVLPQQVHNPRAVIGGGDGQGRVADHRQDHHQQPQVLVLGGVPEPLEGGPGALRHGGVEAPVKQGIAPRLPLGLLLFLHQLSPPFPWDWAISR